MAVAALAGAARTTTTGRFRSRRAVALRAGAVGVFVCLLMALSFPAAVAGSGAFSPHPTTPSFGSGHSSDLVLGDLDGDGDLDAVVANHSVEAETVWLNDGSGTFIPHPTTPSFGAGSAFGLVLGDLDRDGDLDAVFANAGSEPETVWLNDGSGAFSPHPTTPSFGAGASSDVVLGDLDRDGDLDAVVVNAVSQAETVWVNDGSGAFSPHPTTPSFGAGSNSSGVALGDLDGDGDLDAVVSNNSSQPETVWLNDGSGSFGAHPTTSSFDSGNSTAVALGDLDRDGDLDAVVANNLAEPETVWLNDGTSLPTTTSTSTTTTSTTTTSTTTTSTTLVGPPVSKDECKQDGWRRFQNPKFRNQGGCVSYVTTG